MSKVNNKGERQEKTMLKFKKRLKNNFLKDNGFMYIFKTTGKPCSCFMCSGNKYSRKNKHKPGLDDE
jgi:hypothetical protein